MIALPKYGQKLADQLLDLFGHLKARTAFTSKRRYKTAFSLLEMAIVIAILGVLSAVALTNMSSTSEARDASAVQSAQAVLQQVIAQGATRRDTSPTDLLSNQRAN